MSAVVVTPLDILLVTANARFSHTSLALRSLQANLRDLAPRSGIQEFTIDEKPSDIAEQLLRHHPKIICFSVYIWNATLMTETAHIIKQVRPEVLLVAGGPEVSFDSASHPIYDQVDHVIAGEAETSLPRVLHALLDGTETIDKLTVAPPPDLTGIRLPYDLYTDEDLRHRVIYVEASRGCPFTCAFCLSALDKKVRRFPEDAFLAALDTLYRRGARRFKFIDRALHLAITPHLIDFFLERKDHGIFVHFELVPDHLPEKLLAKLKPFPAGAIQVEAGIQSLDADTLARIGRRQNIDKALHTLKRLRDETGVHIHSDLVVGLPGESLDMFERGFNRLFAVGLHEIQVGILKRLPGAPIAAFDQEWKMRYNRQPPYDVLSNRLIDFETMQRLKRFAKVFDLVCNRGHFLSLVPLLIGADAPFLRLLHLTDWLYARTGRTHAIALNRLAELLFDYAVSQQRVTPSDAANAIFSDFKTAQRRSFPGAIERHVTRKAAPESSEDRHLPSRQKRHARHS